jgi:diguanylate cyclase (GGDEF)-like protein
MKLDAFTIAFAGGFVSFASSFFLFLHWFHSREDRAAAAWGAANCAMGLGIVILALHGVVPDALSSIVGALFLLVSSIGAWSAARIFTRGSISRPILTVVTGIVIATPMAIGASGHEQIGTMSGMTICAALHAAAALEFWLARRERLRGRWPMIFLLGLRAFGLFFAAVGVRFSDGFDALPSVSWFGIIHFIMLVYAGGSAICLVTMLKDRSEIKHKAAALTDPLTGLPNRRAFMDRAQRMLGRNLHEGAPFSLLAFDLDKFKKINDGFGHPTGDHVLRIFADTMSRVARPTDMAGRIGGEEFVVALPGCSHDAAIAVAGRIRVAFQKDANFVNGQPIGGTVSAGVATAPEHGASLEELIASADGALYRAKNSGRNRVASAGMADSEPSHSNISRIA